MRWGQKAERNAAGPVRSQARDEVTGLLAFAPFLHACGDALAAYVDAGVPANLTDAAGNTLVMLAAYHGHADTVAALLQRGAEPDRVNDRGQSPLAGAVFKAEEAVVRVLLDAGADPDAGSPNARETAVVFGTERLLR